MATLLSELLRFQNKDKPYKFRQKIKDGEGLREMQGDRKGMGEVDQ